MSQASDTIISLGFDCFYRPETDMFISLGYAVKSDQRIVIRGDSRITRTVTGESRVTKELSAESPVTKEVSGDSCLTKEVCGDSPVAKKIEGSSRIPLENRYPT